MKFYIRNNFAYFNYLLKNKLKNLQNNVNDIPKEKNKKLLNKFLGKKYRFYYFKKKDINKFKTNIIKYHLKFKLYRNFNIRGILKKNFRRLRRKIKNHIKQKKYKKYIVTNKIKILKIDSLMLSYLIKILMNNKFLFILKKSFKILKITIKIFPLFLKATQKKQLFLFKLLKTALLHLISSFDDFSFIFVKFLNFILLFESRWHFIFNFFSFIFKRRFLFFKGANSAILVGIKSFDLSDQILINFYGMHSNNYNASLICNYIKIKLSQYFTIQDVFFKLLKHISSLKGFKISIVGRLNRRERASIIIKRKKITTLACKSQDIDYAMDSLIMKFGIVGIKIWLVHLKSKPFFYHIKFHNL